MKIKPSLRLTLTTILLSLLLVTMGTFGYSFYRNARYTANDLSDQILEQNSALIDSQINEMLHVAVEQLEMNIRLIRSGTFRAGRFTDLARYWLDVMDVYPRLTRLSMAMEATGNWLFVDRRGGKPGVTQLLRDDRTGKLSLSEYQPGDYPDKPSFIDPDKSTADPRRLPWFVAAKANRRRTWSETLMLINSKGSFEVPGLVCATPVLSEDGSLVAVLGVSFDVIKLSNFLRGLEVGSTGFAFVVECRKDGSRQIIAHRDPKLLVRPAKKAKEQGSGALELVPTDELADRLVPAFLGEVPTGIDPLHLKGAQRIEFEHKGVRYLGAYSCLSSRDTPDWLICIVMPEDDVLSRTHQSNRATFTVGLGILGVAMLISLYVSTQVARPLERIARETEAIGRIVLEPHPVAHSVVREVDRLAVAIEQTKTSLRSFRKYVPAELIHLFHSTGLEATLGGEERRMTISFCDLANFTTLADQVSPEELVRHLGDYFGPLSIDVQATGGTVDKYIGDAIMAYWGAPRPNPDHAIAACESALRNQSSLEGLRRKWRLEGKPELYARLGIHTGDVIVGNIGSEARLNYTVMGDPVNMASRLEGLGKYYGTTILIGESTYRDARSAIVARIVDRVSVKGKTEGMLVYELLAMKRDARTEFEELAEMASRAFGLYVAREWDAALALFEEIDRLRPGDGPARVLAGRCRALLDSPPIEAWDGVHRMASK